MTNTTTFAALMALEPAHDHVFIGPPAPERFGRTYGGQFLGQAVMAAARTVAEPKSPHSLHAYFVRAGSVDEPTHYRVEQVREGRSFALREVVATQQDREVFRATVSFHGPEPGLHYQGAASTAVSAVAPPSGDMPDYPAFASGHPDFDPESWDGGRRPMEMRYINPPSSPGGEAVTEPQLMWVRIPPDRVGHEVGSGGALDDVLRAAALAYLSDGSLIDHALLPHGQRWFDQRLTGASLDHAMWFHGRAPLDEWLFYDQRVEWTGASRGLASGRFYDRRGGLLATCAQEGLIRWSTGSAG